MDYRKAYWFEQPHMPGMFNVAVQRIAVQIVKAGYKPAE